MPKVIVYSTPMCPFCVKVKDFLKANNIEFEEVDVSVNQEKAQEMIAKSKQTGVPVVEIDGKIIVGFNPSAIAEELNL